jgi:hypothetical protein
VESTYFTSKDNYERIQKTAGRKGEVRKKRGKRDRGKMIEKETKKGKIKRRKKRVMGEII